MIKGKWTRLWGEWRLQIESPVSKGDIITVAQHSSVQHFRVMVDASATATPLERYQLAHAVTQPGRLQPGCGDCYRRGATCDDCIRGNRTFAEKMEGATP